MVYHGPTLLKHKTGFDDYITMSATASSYCMLLWQGTLVGFLGAFIQCFHINQIADGCAHSLCSMPNLRTFMVLKFLLGEKKLQAPPPSGNNSSNYASMPFPSPPLPVSTVWKKQWLN